MSKNHTRSGRFADDVHADKLRGGYYTPQELADWLCAWAIRENTNRVLEPSCGDGVFLASAAEQLVKFGQARSSVLANLTGIEVIAGEATKARHKLNKILGLRTSGAVETDDFFHWWQQTQPHDLDREGKSPYNISQMSSI
jgi:adenine-specific DNA methylase